MSRLERTNADRDRERSVAPTLFQQFFRSLGPFHLFKDATRGDRLTRAAAYRHNRRMRSNLPRYLVKWLMGSAIAWLSICGFDALASPVGGKVDVFVLMSAGCGIVFAYTICVAVVTASAYLYLGQNEQ